MEKQGNIGKVRIGWVLLGPSNSPTHSTILLVDVRVMSVVAICKGRCRRGEVGGVAGNAICNSYFI